jgi:VWFA-related protein
MVIEFDGEIDVLAKPTADRKKIQKAIRKADFGDGTALYDAVGYTLNDRPAKIAGRKAVVLFTDGVDTQSHRTDGNINLQEAEAGDAPFYIVRYDTFADIQPKPDLDGKQKNEDYIGTTSEEYALGKRYLDELANRTGGKVYPATTNENLATAFAGIAEELRRIYSVGFYPAEAGKAGERRTLEVRVTRPNTTVQARDSYIVGGESQTKTADGKKRKSGN